MNKSLIVLILIVFVTGCDYTITESKLSVTSVDRMNSPDHRYAFYRYFVESSMAFGSGTVRLSILEQKDVLDYDKSDFFTVEGAPIVLGWQNANTLKLAVLINGSRSMKEPHRHETKQWKNFTIEIDYYNMFSAGRSPFAFDTSITKGDTITFFDGNDRKTFVKGECEISYDGSRFNIREISVEVDSTGREGQKHLVLVSSNSWEFTTTKKVDFSEFVFSGVLIKEEPK